MSKTSETSEMSEMSKVDASSTSAAMSDKSAETLSAMLDDEAQELEVRRLLRELENKPQLASRWHRFQIARTAMHGRHGEPVFEASGFAASVRSAIDNEEPLQQAVRGSGWRRTAGGFAIAASVAFVVIAGGQQLALTSAGDAETVARVAPLPVGVVNTTGAVPVQASFGTRSLPALQPADRTAYRELARQRLRRYSQEHAEHASLNTPQGMLPFARVPVIQP